MLGWTFLLALVAPLVTAQVATIYWPVSYPSATYPWVIGQKNLLAWQTGDGTGLETFDIQLHNRNTSVMTGFLPIALRVKMDRLPTGNKNFGGEMEVDLGSNTPTGDGFQLFFMLTGNGQVYARSDQFSIVAQTPSNYTSADLPTATVTATLDATPNPTQQWAVTLDGNDPIATTSAQAIAGNAGSGGGV